MPPPARNRSNLLERASHAATLLSADPRVALVYLFGSTADVRTRVPRDLDLAVLTRPAFTIDELLRRRADLVLAVGASIDLVSLNTAPIVLAHEIVASGRCLFARDPGLETEFVTRTRMRYWDFKP